jgi:hypothetical protein
VVLFEPLFTRAKHRDTTSKENSCLKNIPGTFGLTATLADGTVLGNPAMIDGGINGQDLSTLVVRTLRRVGRGLCSFVRRWPMV